MLKLPCSRGLVVLGPAMLVAAMIVTAAPVQAAPIQFVGELAPEQMASLRGREHSFGLNIRLPFEQRANVIIDGDSKLINFNYFFTRKLNFVKETHAFALFPGGFGTMDEAFEVLTLMQTGKARVIPVVLLDRPGGTYWETWMRFITDHLFKLGFVSPEDFHMFKICHDVDHAVAEILQFYKTYNSVRWVGEQLVIRLAQRLTSDAVAKLRLGQLQRAIHNLVHRRHLRMRIGRARRHLEAADLAADAGLTRNDRAITGGAVRRLPRCVPQ